MAQFIEAVFKSLVYLFTHPDTIKAGTVYAVSVFLVAVAAVGILYCKGCGRVDK